MAIFLALLIKSTSALAAAIIKLFCHQAVSLIWPFLFQILQKIIFALLPKNDLK